MNERHANRKAKQSRDDEKVVKLATKPHQDKSLYQSFTKWDPLTEKQVLTADLYYEKPQSIIVQAGSAGTGKTAWGLQLVITSYSIHYTKLYESLKASCNPHAVFPVPALPA